jgi:hypothetical protein
MEKEHAVGALTLNRAIERTVATDFILDLLRRIERLVSVYYESSGGKGCSKTKEK